MGYFLHLVVISPLAEPIAAAHAKAKELFAGTGHRLGEVSDISTTPINAVCSFMVGPDGSKEGWPESDEGDAAREAFIAWMNESTSLKWAEVAIGSDDEDDSDLVSSWRHTGEAAKG